jgi:hypothetical protein
VSGLALRRGNSHSGDRSIANIGWRYARDAADVG